MAELAHPELPMVVVMALQRQSPATHSGIDGLRALTFDFGDEEIHTAQAAIVPHRASTSTFFRASCTPFPTAQKLRLLPP